MAGGRARRDEGTTTSRGDWVEQGLRILAEDGDGGLTVEGLCARLGRTKGSFYHHFEGRDEYVDALLEEWARRSTDHLIELAGSDGSAEDRLRRLNQKASEEGRPRLERAVRSWATREPRARRTQDRVDRERLELIEGMLRERMGLGGHAARMARVLQLVFIGAQHLDPPLQGPDLYETFRVLGPLLGGEPRGGEGSPAEVSDVASLP